ncbi:MAG: Mrp/NBP35 family ATP-binding protein [Fimbriimonadaceae bacterium]|nr:Mrp/NBP35 family ATP-binding protein [Fimbriimonadaceae bacterium]QYK59642.1 MAG: Mrp/NBP35 family ATP-binding protein [Fimbriimonadaceae bacterium]
MPVRPEDVLGALSRVQDPDLRRDIVSLGFVKDLEVQDGTVSFKVELTTPACPAKDQLEAECRSVVLGLPGVETVKVEMTARVRERAPLPEDLMPGVRQVVAVASGKGGVGKSTVTVNLAVALAQSGARVGLMDADVYGPSIPLMMGVAQERPLTRNSKILPIERFGVAMMSLGFLLEEGQAVLWRGPMVAGTIKQLLTDVEWGDLDYLLVDLPPGTGDAPMSLAQLAPLTGVVIVTTPNAVAASIAGKSAQLFRRLNTAVLGVVENMASYVCPDCGADARLFSGLTGQEFADQIEAPYLGSIPLDPAVGSASDRGTPAIIAAPERPQSEAFRNVARALAAQISVRAIAEPESGTLDFKPVGAS